MTIAARFTRRLYLAGRQANCGSKVAGLVQKSWPFEKRLRVLPGSPPVCVCYKKVQEIIRMGDERP
jgi:hypothetical protein